MANALSLYFCINSHNYNNYKLNIAINASIIIIRYHVYRRKKKILYTEQALID